MPGQPANVNSLSESYDSLISVVFVGSQHQRELATVIDLGDLHLDLLTDRQHVLDGLDAFTVVKVTHLGDVQQTILAGPKLVVLTTVPR